LSATLPSLKKLILAFVLKLVDDIKLINTQTYKAEIMAEFKLSLNASNAITSVSERKEREAQEQRNIAMAEFNNRIIEMGRIGYEYMKEISCFVRKDKPNYTAETIKGLERPAFNQLLFDIKQADILAAQEAAAAVDLATQIPPSEEKVLVVENEVFTVGFGAPEFPSENMPVIAVELKAPAPPPSIHIPAPEVAPAPVVAEEIVPAPEPIYEASFRVEITVPQLKLLKEFFKSNNIKFEDIN